MKKNKDGWRKEKERKRKKRKELILTMSSFGTLLILMYMVISLGSLAQIAIGENVPYMSFWHAPLRWIVDLLIKGGVL